jgi:membrane protein YqaA with SNARE-associated domain
MNNAVEKRAGKQAWIKRRIVPILVIVLVIVISAGLFVFTQRYPGAVEKFKSYGYLGVFIVSLVSCATVIVPVPGILIFLPLITTLNPALVGLAGASGGIIGEITGYMAGYSGHGLAQKSRIYRRVESWMNKYGAWVIFVFAAAPFLTVDIAGIVAGALRYPLWKFMVVGWVGKTIKYIALMYAALWGWDFLMRFIS